MIGLEAPEVWWSAGTRRGNWTGHPLYRPRDNPAMLDGGLAKLMRMSMRNMW
jgi:hypothetical protein